VQLMVFSFCIHSEYEHGLWVCESRGGRGISGAKRDDVTGKWRKLHHEELHDLYCSPNIVRLKNQE
jgi:hypothetical protein